MKKPFLRSILSIGSALLLCLAVLCLPAPAASAATESTAWQLVGQAGGVTKALYLRENTLFVGCGLHVLALDVSNPSAARLIGASPLLPQPVEGIADGGAGRLLVCCGSGGLILLDASEPAAPAILGALNTPGYTENAALYGDYAVIADGPQGVQVADLSDPSQPAIVSEAYPLAYAYDVALRGSVAYCAGGTSGLFVIDLGDPLAPAEAGLIPLNGCQYDAELIGDTLCLAGAWGGVTAFSLEQPLSPLQASVTETAGWAMALAGTGQRLMVPDGADGVAFYDLAGGEPALISTYPYDGYVIAGATDGRTAFVLDEAKGLLMVDTANAARPTSLARWIPLLDGRRLDVQGDFCYVAGGQSGMHVLDIGNPDAPLETDWYDTGDGYANEIEAEGDTVFLAMRLIAPKPLQAFDISDAGKAKLLGVLDNTASLYQIKGGPLMVRGDYAYMTGGDPMAIDIRDLSSLRGLGSVQGTETNGGDQRGNLFIARGNHEMIIIDTSDPTNLRVLSRLNVDSSGATARFISDTLFLASTVNGVDVYDVSDPINPRSIASLDLPGDVADMFISGDTAYLCAQGAGVFIVNLQNPKKPTLLGTVKTPVTAWDCHVQGDTMYVAGSTYGLLIYRRGDAAARTEEPAQAAAPADLVLGPIPDTLLKPQTEPVALEKPRQAYALVVTSAADSGPGTLREALDPNRLEDNTTITFDPAVFPSDQSATIQLASQLPSVDRNYVTVDDSNAGVILDGGGAIERGLDLYGMYETVMGLQFKGFTFSAVASYGAYARIGGNRNAGEGPVGQGNQAGYCNMGVYVYGYGTVVQGNLIGVDVTGAEPAPNWSGIFVTDGDYTTVGGTQPGEGNVVSASERGNITSWCDHVRIVGNLIGVDITGTKPIAPRSNYGLFCESAATNNIVGGTAPGERNVISNARIGLIFGDQKTYQCTAVGNYIGTDITGTVAIPNDTGFFSYVSCHNRVGGTGAGEGNVISGSLSVGVDPLSDTFVLGNLIGLAADGETPLPNDTAVQLRSGTILGGYTAAEGNRIYGGTFAIRAGDTGVTGGYVAGNAFLSPSASGLWLANNTSGLFIQHNRFAATGNYTVVLDGGAGNAIRSNAFAGKKPANFILPLHGGNLELKPPKVKTAKKNALSGTACAYGRVEIYRYADGQATPLGVAQADAAGKFAYADAELVKGVRVLLTVTDPFNNTSAFSKAYPMK